MDIKSALFALIRSSHVYLSVKPLPRRIGLCFHELEAGQHGAFGAGITHLKGQGYRAVDPAEFVNDRSDERLMLIAFDDNFRGWYTALDLFDELKIRATFYINTLPMRDVAMPETIQEFYDRIRYHGDRTPLTRSELTALHTAGHTVACHTHSHFNLGRLPRALWDKEILEAKRELEDIIGESVRHFSWPFGMRRNFSNKLRTYCAGIGFETIAAATPGLLHISDFDPLNIQRTRWRLEAPLEQNLLDIRIDGRLFTAATGRSAIG
jgi:peptidoglycan/xylan/chitin deacetylase (PgdA/CDA1 family)